MKKIVALLLAVALMIGTGCVALADEEDGLRFQQEYEAENGQLDNSGLYVLPELQLSADEPFEYEDFEDVEELLTEGTGVLYLGFPRCPWCRSLVPVMIDAWKQSGAQEEIAYFNALDLRDKCSLAEDGTIVVEQEAAPEYDRLVELLYDWLGEYEGLNDPSIKRIYFPTVVFVREGKIEYVHIGTVDAQDRGESLTDEEYNDLVALFAEHMQGLLDD